MSYVLAVEIETVDNIATFAGLGGLFQNVIGALLFVAGIILFFMLIAGAIKYISSGGDPKALESARNTIAYAIIGMIAIASGYLILVLLSDFTGNTSLLNFSVVNP